MSKKDRVKGNVKPAKSVDAAALVAGNAQSFVGFDTQSSFFLIPEIQTQLKKLSKKDSCTKIKGLNDLSGILPNHGAETWLSVLPQWCRIYPKLCSDDETSVRRQTQALHRLIVSNTKKEFVPYMKSVTGYWLLSMFDPYAAAGKEAKSAFFAIFPDEKWKNALLFCKEEISALILENFAVDSRSLDDDSESSQHKFNRLISQSLALTKFLIDSSVDVRAHVQKHVLPTLISSVSFNKLIESQDGLIQKNFLALLEAMTSWTELMDIFEIEVVTGVSLKPIEHFSLTETDDNVCSKSCSLIAKLENTKLYSRAAKHEKQWRTKLISSVSSFSPTNVVHISSYLRSSLLLKDLQSQWLTDLVKNFEKLVQDTDCRLGSLNDTLTAIFSWTGTEIEDVVTRFVEDSLQNLSTGQNQVLLQTSFFVLIHESSVNCKALFETSKNCIESCIEECGNNEFAIKLLLKFLKPKPLVKKVTIVQKDQTEVDTNTFDEIFFSNLEKVKGLKLDTDACIELTIAIQEKFLEQNPEFKVCSEYMQDLLIACTSKSERLLSDAAVLLMSCNYSLEELSQLCSKLDARALTPIIKADLKSESKTLFRSEKLLDLIGNDGNESLTAIIAANCNALDDQLIEKYIVLFRNQKMLPVFAEKSLKVLESSRNVIRLTIFESVLSDCSDTDSFHEAIAKDFCPVLEAFLISDGLEYSQKEWAFGIMKNSLALFELKANILTSVLSIFVENLEANNKLDFSNLLDNLVEKELHNSLSLCSSSILKALIFNAVLPAHKSFSSVKVEDINVSSVFKFLNFVAKISGVLSDPKFSDLNIDLSKWGKVSNVLSSHIVPFASYETGEKESRDIAQIFSDLEETNFLVDLQKSEGFAGDNGQLIYLNSLSLLSESSEKIFRDYVDALEMSNILHVQTMNSSNNLEKMSKVITEILGIISDQDELLCDGEDIKAFPSEVQILNRQVLISIVIFLQNESLTVEVVQKLWDSVLCVLVCYGNSLQKTEVLSDNLNLVSFAQWFLKSYELIEDLVAKFDHSDLNQEWHDVFKQELIQSCCNVCIKLIKSELPREFNTKILTEVSCLKRIDSGTLKQSISCFTDGANCISFLSPGLLSRSCVTQFMACLALEKIIIGSEDFVEEWANMLLKVAELSAVDCDSMLSIGDLENSDTFEIVDNETNQAVTSFLMAMKLLALLLSKLKSAKINALLESELFQDVKIESFLSFLFRIIDTEAVTNVDYNCSDIYSSVRPKRSQQFLSDLAVDCYMTSILSLPQLCRSWFERLDRRKREVVDWYTAKFLSPFVIRKAFGDVNTDKDMNKDDRLTIKTFQGQNTIQAQYSIEDFAIDVKLSFAKNYPLGRINIEEIKKKKVGKCQ